MELGQVSRFKFTRRCNYWCAFIAASLTLLRRGGSLAFVLPASWEFANYAEPFRDRLPHLFNHFESHRCDVPLFDYVQEGAVVILARGFLETPGSTPKRMKHKSSELMYRSLRSSRARANSANVEHRVAHGSTYENDPDTCLAQEVMEFKIGAVSGDAAYFLLRESDRDRLEIPPEACNRVLTRSRHLKAAVIDESTWEELRQSNERIWLFNPTEDTIKVESIARYLKDGLEKGKCRTDGVTAQSWVYGFPFRHRLAMMEA
jgi:hypothetical protein